MTPGVHPWGPDRGFGWAFTQTDKADDPGGGLIHLKQTKPLWSELSIQTPVSPSGSGGYLLRICVIVIFFLPGLVAEWTVGQRR